LKASADAERLEKTAAADTEQSKEAWGVIGLGA
jgi:hypothetical protein